MATGRVRLSGDFEYELIDGNRVRLTGTPNFELLDGVAPPPPVDPPYFLQRPFITQQIVPIYQRYGAVPGPRGSGPTDLEYYIDIVIEKGGWVNPNTTGGSNIGYFTDMIQLDRETHGYRRQS